MATEQIPLLFFRTTANADPLATARCILDSSPTPNIIQLDPNQILRAIQKVRGFARLKISLPCFSFDSRRTEAAFEGIAQPSHIHVRFYGNLDQVAEPLFNILTSLGLQCYSIWDKRIITEWPKWDEPAIDSGFSARMARILERKTLELRKTVPDEKQRSRILNAFTNSPEFRAEMVAEARREASAGERKTFADAVNCYARWKSGRASALEIGAVRKLDPKYAAMSLAELRERIGDSPRLLLLTAVTPRQASEFRASAEQLGVQIDTEPS